jgi:hypothetical protein
MKSKLRRIEVLLPARYNDGAEVPDDLLGEAVNEIIDQFSAVSWYKNEARAIGTRRVSSFATQTRTASG